MCDRISSINFGPGHCFSSNIRTIGFKSASCCYLPKSAKQNPNSRNSIRVQCIPSRDEYKDLDFLSIDQEQNHERGPIEIEEYPENVDIEGLFEVGIEEKGNDKLAKNGEIFDLRVEKHDAKSKRGQIIRSSNLLAKQVISITSALSLGFVYQLWVDVDSWTVVVVEVRPTLLSGDFERFLLEDIKRVGDVILIEDGNVIEDDLKLVGLETLVGCTVMTPSRRCIGKVRSYTFNINTGAVELLELDSFGISLIPSSFLTTYALSVEDVVEVFSDTVVVCEAASSRMQRLTKGFFGSLNANNFYDEIQEQVNANGQENRTDHKQRRRRNSSRKKSQPKKRKSFDDLELPMDYL